MHGGHRVSRIAARGDLIAVAILLFAGKLDAKDVPDLDPAKPARQSEYEPQPQAGGAGPANQEGHGPNSIAPTTASQDRPREDSSADNGEEETTDGKTDLQAQWSMAESAERMLFWAWLQTIIAGAGAILVFLALIFSGVSTRAAVEANKINREAMIAEHRPWIPARVQILGGIPCTPQGDWFISIQFSFENIGRNPAIHVDGYAEPFYVVDVDRDPISAQLAFSEKVRTAPIDIGKTLFPGEKDSRTISFIIENERVNSSKEYFRKANPDSSVALVYIIGCVQYISLSDNKRHQSGFVRWLRVFGSNERTYEAWPNEGDIAFFSFDNWLQDGKVD